MCFFAPLCFRRLHNGANAKAENNVVHPDGAYISAEMIEDAALRVVILAAMDYKDQFENAALPAPQPPENGSAIDKQI